MHRITWPWLVATLLLACGAPGARPDASVGVDGGAPDAGPVRDAGVPDAGARDAGPPDAGPFDGGPPFVPDAGALQVPWNGGPVLADAWLVLLLYPGVPEPQALVALADALPDSGWLHAVGAEYGVGLVGSSHYDVPFVAPTSFGNGDVAALIEQGLDAGLWPETTPDGSVPVWMVFYPPGTQNTEGPYSGEHLHVAVDGGQRVISWVAPYLEPPDAGVAPYEVITTHELIEALTDPYVFRTPGWRVTDPLSAIAQVSGGGAFSGGELGDLCEYFPPVALGPWSVTRSWSNEASAAGRCPCVPAPTGEPWAGLRGPLEPITLSPGQSVQVPLQLVSTPGVTRWALSLSGQAQTGQTLTDQLALSVSAEEAVVGQPLFVTLEAVRFTPHDTRGTWLLVSQVDGGLESELPIDVVVR
jgi:hypothetical protein